MPDYEPYNSDDPGAASAASGASESLGADEDFELGMQEQYGWKLTGRLESLDGTWLVTWDHTDAGYLTYHVEDREDGGSYVARWDDGWRVAPEGRATVDMERLLPEGDTDLMELIEVLNRASGRQAVPGVHTWRQS